LREQFVTRLERIAGRHPGWINGPFGYGLMIAFTPFDGSEGVAKRLLTALFEAGVVSFLCGANPMRLRFLPPLGVVMDEQLDQACRILEDVLAKHAAAV
jgi:acetylornithine aminotransferase